MRKRTKKDRYTDAPPDISDAIMSAVEIMDDFPPPEDLKRQRKKAVTLRLDPDVYQWFRKPGSGYQTRINMVLRAYMVSKMEPTSRSPKAKNSRGGKSA